MRLTGCVRDDVFFGARVFTTGFRERPNLSFARFVAVHFSAILDQLLAAVGITRQEANLEPFAGARVTPFHPAPFKFQCHCCFQGVSKIRLARSVKDRTRPDSAKNRGCPGHAAPAVDPARR
jgi:hypothetical protein